MRKSVRAIIVKDDNLLVMKRNKYGDEFYALVGGGIDFGETPEEALHREVQEEAMITFTKPRLVIVEEAGNVFGTQFIYLCEYDSGEPRLSPKSEEAQSNALGQNLYGPMWMPLKHVKKINLLPAELKTTVLNGLEKGFPPEPLLLTIQS